MPKAYSDDMDVKNLGEFAGFCQERAEDKELSTSVDFAEQLADLSVRMSMQYGGHGRGVGEFIGDAFSQLQANGMVVDQNTLMQAREVLTRFWEHGEAFDAWFSSKVVIIQP